MHVHKRVFQMFVGWRMVLGCLYYWSRKGYMHKKQIGEFISKLHTHRLHKNNTEGTNCVTIIQFSIPLEQKSFYTHNFYCWGIKFCNCTHTHISYTSLIVEESIYVMRVYLWYLFVLPLLYHTERQLHNHNDRGINIQNTRTPVTQQ